MSVEIIQIHEAEGETWGEWAWNRAKERPYLVALAAPAAVVAAPFIATTAATVGTATVGGLAVAGAAEMIWGPGSKPPITFYSPGQAEGIVDVYGQLLSLGVTYLRHPKSREGSGIIKSTDFHDFIMSEKIAEIVHYMRAETRLRSLSILVRSSDSKHALVDGNLKAVPAKARAGLSNQHERRINLTCEDPSRIPHEERYIWIDEFPEVVAATRNAERGTISFSQSTDMQFGMSGELAKFIKLNAGWLSTFVIEVEASFA